MIRTIAANHKEFFDLMENNASAQRLRKYVTETLPKFREDQAKGSKRKQPRRPPFSVNPNRFLQFIRSPFAVGFRVQGHPGVETYDFLAVNAHLHYGRPRDRRAEAAAVIEWILGKARSGETPFTVLLGDLNFDIDKPTSDLKRIGKAFTELGGFSERKRVYPSFPFVHPHPRPLQDHPEGEIFRTNILETQTYDQIGIFSSDKRVGGRLETRLEGHSPKEQWGQPGAPDYGVFKMSNLFSHALNGKALSELTKKQRTAFVNRFQHTGSDHMPIWLRMPLPRSGEGFPTK